MEFAHKELLFLLFLPIGFSAVYALRRRRASARFKSLFGAGTGFLLSRSNSLFPYFSFIAPCFFIIALARPQGPLQKMPAEKAPSLPLLLAIDVSLSMQAEDVLPNRLEFAKREADRFLQVFSGGASALAVFAAEAALIVPFTEDRSLIRLFLKDISSDYLLSKGSDLKNLFSQIKTAFQGLGGQNASSPKAVVLISDGEIHETALGPSFQALVQDNIRFFTLSVGSEAGAAIPLRNRKGKITGYKKDRFGRPAATQSRPEFLKNLSRRSRGAYYHADSGGGAARHLLQDLQALKKSRISRRLHKRKEFYPYPLSAGLILAFSAFFSWTRQKKA